AWRLKQVLRAAVADEVDAVVLDVDAAFSRCGGRAEALIKTKGRIMPVTSFTTLRCLATGLIAAGSAGRWSPFRAHSRAPAALPAGPSPCCARYVNRDRSRLRIGG